MKKQMAHPAIRLCIVSTYSSFATKRDIRILTDSFRAVQREKTTPEGKTFECGLLLFEQPRMKFNNYFCIILEYFSFFERSIPPGCREKHRPVPVLLVRLYYSLPKISRQTQKTEADFSFKKYLAFIVQCRQTWYNQNKTPYQEEPLWIYRKFPCSCRPARQKS